MRRILFVCVGNTCRSPMAQAIAVSIARERGEDWLFEFDSAGIGPDVRKPRTDPKAVRAVSETGMDGSPIQDRAWKRIEDVITREWDFIVVMEQRMKRLVVL